ncbi:MAG TPA: hypothetical protein VFQ24_18795 [Terriglobia bacterium]|nr:hypothetical protein [Terriglobia bacterium]
MGQKNTFFEKRTGEVIENKGKLPKNEPETNLKRSGEVVENTCLWKKRTGTNRKTKLPILLKTLETLKIKPKTNRSFSEGLDDRQKSTPHGRRTPFACIRPMGFVLA